eukprot:70045-Prorocentrum_minimum.AAC.1
MRVASAARTPPENCCERLLVPLPSPVDGRQRRAMRSEWLVSFFSAQRRGLRESVASFSNDVAGTDAHDVMNMMVLTQVLPPPCSRAVGANEAFRRQNVSRVAKQRGGVGNRLAAGAKLRTTLRSVRAAVRLWPEERRGVRAVRWFFSERFFGDDVDAFVLLTDDPLTLADGTGCWQYFDMLREVGMKGGGSTLMLPQNPGAMCKIANEIRQGFLEREDGSLTK